MDLKPKNIIQELKEAGDELKENKNFIFEKKSSPGSFSTLGQTNPKPKDEANFLKNIKNINEYQDELQSEKSRLEKAHQEIKDLEKKLAERIELLNKLQNRSTEINKIFEEFQTELAQAKKENSNIIDNIIEPIKNKLGNHG